MAKNNKIYFRVDDQERDMLQKKCHPNSISEWAREMLLGDDSLVDPDWLLFIKELPQDFLEIIAWKSKSKNDCKKWAEYVMSLVEPKQPPVVKWWAGARIVPNPNGDKCPYSGGDSSSEILVLLLPNGTERDVTDEHPDWDEIIEDLSEQFTGNW